MKYKGFNENVYHVSIITIMGFVALSCVFPLIYIIGMSLSTEGELLQNNYMVIIPRNPSILAYKYILNQSLLLSGILISAGRVIAGTALTLLFVLVSAYILAQRDLPCIKGMLIFIITTIFINGGLIPSYLLMSRLGLLNNFWVYIVPGLGSTFSILVLKVFIENMPGDIIQSAEIDGAGDIHKLIHIVAPLTLPALAAIGLFTAVGHWNSWFDAMVYIRDTRLFTAQLVIRNLLSSALNTDNVILQDSSMKMTPETLKMASVVVGMIPILCVYPFLQKYFIHGVYLGATKE